MSGTLALRIPHSGPAYSQFRIARVDVVAGIGALNIWGRLGWRETKRRYRRTMFGPFWTTVGLAVFVTTLGFLWSNLWHRDPKTYLPYLTSGMVCWVMLSITCTEACGTFIVNEQLLKQLRISYTLLACTNVWRNAILFLHNLAIYAVVFIYAGLSINLATVLFIPGFLLYCVNAIWISCILAMMCARFRDIQQLVITFLQIALFLTPIFWTPDQLTGRTAIVAELNPLYHLIAIVRDPLLGVFPPSSSWFAAILIAVAGWATTMYMMTKFRRRIVYWL